MQSPKKTVRRLVNDRAPDIKPCGGREAGMAPSYFAAAALFSFFQVRTGGLVMRPFLMAFTVTRT